MSTKTEGISISTPDETAWKAGLERDRALAADAERARRLIDQVINRPHSSLPRLTTDQKVELRTVAPMVLAGARSAVGTITTIAAMQPRGVFEACALSACSSFASLASSLALVGAAVALAVCNDGEETDPPAATTTTARSPNALTTAIVEMAKAVEGCEHGITTTLTLENGWLIFRVLSTGLIVHTESMKPEGRDDEHRLKLAMLASLTAIMKDRLKVGAPEGSVSP